MGLRAPTEATVCATTYRCEPDRDGPVPIGCPIANTQIYILDRHLQSVPFGVSGEIHIGGVGVARGYLNRTELTAERFFANPFSADPKARLYKTGDLGRWLPDGDIEYLGRNDLQVKIRGFRIELGEIEARLAACAGVREAVVIAREDSSGEKRLVAYVVAQDRVELSAATLRDELSTVLPSSMMPNAFVSLEALPLTPSGKLDRGALTASDFVRGDVGYAAPRTPSEKLLSVIWAQVLSLDKVGVHDRFCALGGHSLLAVRLSYEIKRQLNVTVPLGTILAAPTVALLAVIVETIQRDGQDHVKGV